MTRKKTNAKRIGVKSTIAFGNGKYAITTFGKGATAEIALKSADSPAKTFPSRSAPELSIQAAFDQARPNSNQPDFVDPTRISAARGDLSALLTNPVEAPESDYLELKDALERKVFGDEFPQDTIRIQIANAILDVQRILGIYVADILHFVDALQDEPEDLARLGLRSDKMTKLLTRARPYFGFFGGSEVFKICEGRNVGADVHNGKVFRALGVIRKKLANFDWKRSLVLFSENATLPEKFFSSEAGGATLWSEVVAPLCRKRLERVRRTFVKMSAKNLTILNEIFGDDTEEKKKARARQYYRFSVLKEGKNLGFNLTKTREYVIDKYYPIFHDQRIEVKRVVDTFRPKLYALLDFVIFQASVSGVDECAKGRASLWQTVVKEALVKLRETPDDDAKEKIYQTLAEKARLDGSLFRIGICSVCDAFLLAPDRPSFPELLRRNDAITRVAPEWLEETNGEDASSFVQLVAFLCNFLEVKEINELVTAFARKFECVQALINLLRELEGADAVKFTETFALFNGLDGNMAGKIAQELRLLASVGKMKPDMTSAKRILYKNALEILGVKDEEMTDEWLEEHILLSKPSAVDCKMKKKAYDEALRRNKGIDKKRQEYEDAKNALAAAKEAYDEKKKDVNPFRNYIVKNVITSRAFYYLVRYAKPSAVRKLMGNPKIIRYVLTRLPNSQIYSYYRVLCPNEKDVDAPEPADSERREPYLRKRIRLLADALSNFSFAVLMDDKDKIVAASRSRNVNLEVERLKKLTTLYMSIAYIAVKNLVKVNARYFIAYSSLERDLALFEEKHNEKLARHYVDVPVGDNKTLCFRLLAILDFYLERDAETLRRRGEICREISRLNADYYGTAGQELSRSEIDDRTEEEKGAWRAVRASAVKHTAEENRVWREKKNALNAERKACEKRLHFGVRWRQDVKNRDKNKDERPQKWYDILANHRAELFALQSSGFIATIARNDVGRLITINKFAEYIADVRRYPEGTPKEKDFQISSYFEIFHYLRQRAFLESILANSDARFSEEQLKTLESILAKIKMRNSYDKDLLKLEYLPFSYCLPRYKNLTIEALFDPDSDSAKKAAKAREVKKGGNAK